METISACIVVQDEEFTLRASVLSIAPLVDEILIFENSSCDRTPDILQELSAAGVGTRLRIVQDPGIASLAEIRNLLEDKAESDWILWWDADFVATQFTGTSAQSTQELIRTAVEESREYNQILFCGANIGRLFGFDLESRPLHGRSGDTQIVRKGFMRFRVSNFVDTRYYLQERRCRFYNHAELSSFLHVDIKNPVRLSIRPYIYEFRRRQFLGEVDCSFGEFLFSKLGHTDISRLVDGYLNRSARRLVFYDQNRWGRVPRLLEELREKQPIELVDGILALTETGRKRVRDYKWSNLISTRQ
jgi:glycosyltransferase involved in cell wall biosynthesis